jgi:hypothetical protein
MIYKGKVAGFHHVYLVDARHGVIGSAGVGGANHLGNFGQRVSSVKFHRLSVCGSFLKLLQ